MTSLYIDVFNKLGINKHWFSKTTKGIAMKSCIYFTATRNIMASDVVHVFENILSLGIVYEKYVNIVPVSNKNYNHVFFKIQWNDNVETANFVNEIVMKSYVKVFHNKGYWVCRMSNNPLKLRNLSKCVKVASFYCDNSESDADSESDSQEQNVTIQVKETNEEEDKVSTNQEEDFYVIKEEFKEEINSVVE